MTAADNHEAKYKYSREEILNEMRNCDDCLSLKMEGICPACCQYHLDMQFKRA